VFYHLIDNILFHTGTFIYSICKEHPVPTIEKTLAIIKPDAVGKKVTGKIITLIEENDFRITAMKMVHLSRSTAEQFYRVHSGKSFYEGLIEFMSSGPSLVLVLEGDKVIERWRALMGPTDPENAPPGTIRKLFGTTVRYNATHGSDSAENATLEIAYFFAGIDAPVAESSQKESES
jgi:nucleoside-diphosphate kinase